MTSAIESAYRTDAARILGAVAHYTGDLQLAEDAVQDAFLRALAQERAGTVLRNPAAWITTSARRIAVDYLRRARTAARAIPALAAQTPPAEETDMSDFVFTGDERLELILMMCHPELAEEARIALALRFVCAVPTREVAAMLLVPEATMAARLTRAKRRLHDSEIRFGMDDDADVSRRLPDALTVISLVYTTGYAAPGADTSARLRADAIELARDAVRIRPGDAEASGLLGLLLLTEARQSTRLDPAGELVELATADRAVWDAALIAEGGGLRDPRPPGRHRAVRADGRDRRPARDRGRVGRHGLVHDRPALRRTRRALAVTLGTPRPPGRARVQSGCRADRRGRGTRRPAGPLRRRSRRDGPRGSR
ncbi:MAG TPA: sigma-70 family RNA polymerase sigma factor, partial [Microbacterium sp.]|nr:sigma-70 family RNA polymerase sigma factor [Microbacterium sp.]